MSLVASPAVVFATLLRGLLLALDRLRLSGGLSEEDQMPLCKICNRHASKLIRCHIYPAALSKEAAGEDRKLISMSMTNGPRASFATAGLFDEHLACLDCERLFGPADNYAIMFRRRGLALNLPVVQWTAASLPTFDADPERLHTFAMNTLLRAHFSDRWEVRSVHVPEIAGEALAALQGGRATIHSGREVAIILTRSDLAGFLATPHPLDIGGHSVYAIQLPNMMFYVAMSCMGLGPAFSHMALRPGREVTVWRRRKPVPQELFPARDMFEALGNRVDRMLKLK